MHRNKKPNLLKPSNSFLFKNSDYDHDGVPSVLDCSPKNKYKQGDYANIRITPGTSSGPQLGMPPSTADYTFDVGVRRPDGSWSGSPNVGGPTVGPQFYGVTPGRQYNTINELLKAQEAQASAQWQATKAKQEAAEAAERARKSEEEASRKRAESFLQQQETRKANILAGKTTGQVVAQPTQGKESYISVDTTYSPIQESFATKAKRTGAAIIDVGKIGQEGFGSYWSGIFREAESPPPQPIVTEVKPQLFSGVGKGTATSSLGITTTIIYPSWQEAKTRREIEAGVPVKYAGLPTPVVEEIISKEIKKDLESKYQSIFVDSGITEGSKEESKLQEDYSKEYSAQFESQFNPISEKQQRVIGVLESQPSAGKFSKGAIEAGVITASSLTPTGAAMVGGYFAGISTKYFGESILGENKSFKERATLFGLGVASAGAGLAMGNMIFGNMPKAGGNMLSRQWIKEQQAELGGAIFKGEGKVIGQRENFQVIKVAAERSVNKGTAKQSLTMFLPSSEVDTAIYGTSESGRKILLDKGFRGISATGGRAKVTTRVYDVISGETVSSTKLYGTGTITPARVDKLSVKGVKSSSKVTLEFGEQNVIRGTGFIKEKGTEGFETFKIMGVSSEEKGGVVRSIGITPKSVVGKISRADIKDFGLISADMTPQSIRGKVSSVIDISVPGEIVEEGTTIFSVRGKGIKSSPNLGLSQVSKAKANLAGEFARKITGKATQAFEVEQVRGGIMSSVYAGTGQYELTRGGLVPGQLSGGQVLISDVEKVRVSPMIRPSEILIGRTQQIPKYHVISRTPVSERQVIGEKTIVFTAQPLQTKLRENLRLRTRSVTPSVSASSFAFDVPRFKPFAFPPYTPLGGGGRQPRRKKRFRGGRTGYTPSFTAAVSGRYGKMPSEVGGSLGYAPGVRPLLSPSGKLKIKNPRVRIKKKKK